MYHVELRQDGNHVRAFNLTEAGLRARVLEPLRRGRPFTLEDKRFDPSLVRLTVLEGPELRLDQLTLGRGWVEAQRGGDDVTACLVAGSAGRPPAAGTRVAGTRRIGPSTPDPAAPTSGSATREQLKERIIGRVSAGPAPLAELPALAADLLPGQRASAQLAETEMAVWELLHQQRVQLLRRADALPPEDWEAAVLAAASWFGSGSLALTHRTTG